MFKNLIVSFIIFVSFLPVSFAANEDNFNINSPAQIQIYMAKSMIPLAGFLLIIQGVSEVMRCIIAIRTGHWPSRLVVAEETEKILMRTSQEENKADVI